MRFLKRNNFCFEIKFSQAQHSIFDFLNRTFFYATDVFSMRLLKFVFTETPPQFLPETKRFASVKDSSRFSALCDLPETIKKLFGKNFSLKFLFFLKGFPLRKMGFRDTCVSLRVFFWRSKVDEISISFYFWFSV